MDHCPFTLTNVDSSMYDKMSIYKDSVAKYMYQLMGPERPGWIDHHNNESKNTQKLIFEITTYILLLPEGAIEPHVKQSLFENIADLLLEELDTKYQPSVTYSIKENLLSNKESSITVLGDVIMPVLSNKSSTVIDIISMVLLLYLISPKMPTVAPADVLASNAGLLAFAYRARGAGTFKSTPLDMNNDVLAARSWFLSSITLEHPTLASLKTNEWTKTVTNSIKYLGMVLLLGYNSRQSLLLDHDKLTRYVFNKMIEKEIRWN